MKNIGKQNHWFSSDLWEKWNKAAERYSVHNKHIITDSSEAFQDVHVRSMDCVDILLLQHEINIVGKQTGCLWNSSIFVFLRLY